MLIISPNLLWPNARNLIVIGSILYTDCKSIWCIESILPVSINSSPYISSSNSILPLFFSISSSNRWIKPTIDKPLGTRRFIKVMFLLSTFVLLDNVCGTSLWNPLYICHSSTELPHNFTNWIPATPFIQSCSLSYILISSNESDTVIILKLILFFFISSINDLSCISVLSVAPSVITIIVVMLGFFNISWITKCVDVEPLASNLVKRLLVKAFSSNGGSTMLSKGYICCFLLLKNSVLDNSNIICFSFSKIWPCVEPDMSKPTPISPFFSLINVISSTMFFRVIILTIPAIL